MARILCLDDDENILRNLTQTLEMEGHEVVGERDGRAGLDRLYRDRAFELIVTDLSMPTLDGRQFIEQVRMNPIFREIPIVVLTGNDDTSDLKGKVAAVIGKPFSIDFLIQTIHSNLG